MFIPRALFLLGCLVSVCSICVTKERQYKHFYATGHENNYESESNGGNKALAVVCLFLFFPALCLAKVGTF